MKILQKEIIGIQTSFSTNFGGKPSFILCFLFPERLHCCYIYFTVPTCTIITLEPCAKLSISYPDLIKFHYFARISLKVGIGGESRGDRGENDGDFMDNSKF
jgi:hypothetical protein